MQSLGLLRESSSQDDPAALRRRLAEDGYLYLPGVLGRERVLAARMAMLKRVQSAAPHLLLDDAATPLEMARMDPGASDRSGWGDAWGVMNVLVGNEDVHSPASTSLDAATLTLAAGCRWTMCCSAGR